MKKSIVFLALIITVQIFVLVGCGSKGSVADAQEDNRISIVCTAFPQYDWVKNIIAGNEGRFILTLLMENGGDLHNFQPSALDIARVSACDMFIYVGGESDGWVEDVIKEAVNPDMCVINMMDAAAPYLLEEESLEEDNSHEGHEMDEHIWLSLRNAEVLVEYIAAALEKLDQADASLYRKNCESYIKKLKALDAEFVQAAAGGDTDTLLFADRFPFRYFVADYGLKYYAAFEGCSAETEASFKIVAFLTGKLDELGLKTVLVTDGADDRLAQVIIENAHTARQQHILVLHSLQSVSKKDIANGFSYLSAMEENLAILKTALAIQ